MAEAPTPAELSRRERQIMDALYLLGEGSAAEVVEVLREPEAHDSIRVTLTVLERKGYVLHRKDGRRNVYHPVVARERARKQAVGHLVRTFFGGSASRALLSFLDLTGDELGEADLAELEAWVAERAKRRAASRKRGRRRK